MDMIALSFYAAICGLLSLAAPAFGTPGIRLAVGAGVGIAAAAALPFIRSTVGY
ncbi:hypothetical protein [Gymnodinialimonas sp. 57CJ19]|uniref:hypothetical protein n=1 Tax=Gymnodinialimonas sp. 57CJ19 TaxID=3138498 RepID=UPI0022060E90|nr:hypothetical protein K3728_18270 [Rhodobacteraceae bacterium M385]